MSGTGSAFGQGSLSAITQGFGNVTAADDGRTFEVGERAGDTHHPVIAARRKTQPVGGANQQRAAITG